MGRVRFALIVCAIAAVAVACGKKDDKKKAPDKQEAKQPEAEAKAPPPEPEPEKSLYDRLGGRDKIAEMSGKVLEALPNNEVLKKNPKIMASRDKVDPKQLHEHVTNFICKATGGPCEYTGRTMAESHAHLEISKEEWDAMGKDFKGILDEMQIGPKEQEELLALIGSLENEIVTKK